MDPGHEHFLRFTELKKKIVKLFFFFFSLIFMLKLNEPLRDQSWEL